LRHFPRSPKPVNPGPHFEHQFSFIAGNLAPSSCNEAEHELSGPKNGILMIEKECLTIRFLFA